jgi:hypothetical protein
MTTSKKVNSVDIGLIKDGKVHIHWNYQTFYKSGNGDRVACFIPAFDIYFQARNFQDIRRKSDIVTEMFFDYYIVDVGKNTLKKLALKLHQLGFKAPKDMLVMREYANQRPIPTTFTSNRESLNGFSNAESISASAELSLSGVE